MARLPSNFKSKKTLEQWFNFTDKKGLQLWVDFLQI